MKGGDEVKKRFLLGFKPIFTIACFAVSILLVIVLFMNFLLPNTKFSVASSKCRHRKMQKRK